LLTQDMQLSLLANHTTTAFPLALASLFVQHGVVIVKLEMRNATGKLLSDNVYWLAGDDREYRRLNTLAAVKLRSSATVHSDGAESIIDLQLTNDAATAAIATKAVLFEAKSSRRILPAYFSDNYITVLPGETKSITIRYPTKVATGNAEIQLRGWNVKEATVAIAFR
jgi:hypothetical protein